MQTNLIDIGGFLPFTSIDFPDHLAAVIFCQGCSWRCQYCYNSSLQPRCGGSIQWDKVKSDLEARKGFLDGVVFSGGEPLLQKHLKDAMAELANFGFKIGLHTSGALPLRLFEVLPVVDWVGFDVKAPFNKYSEITQIKKSGQSALESLKMLLDSKTSYEVRTTIDPKTFTESFLLEIAEELAELGVETFVLQAFHSLEPDKSMDVWQKEVFFENAALINLMRSKFRNFNVRS